MKKIGIIATILLFVMVLAHSQGYNVGAKASEFKLKNVDGKFVSLADFPKAKGFVVVFTCNHCPYAIAYQDRIIALDKKYKSQDYPVIAINPNDPAIEPADSYQAMIVRAKEKAFAFPYLFDETQDVYRKYGATRTPHVFVLQKNEKKDFIVKYIGTIDDNYEEPSKVTKTYLSDAIDALLAGKDPDPAFTKAIGCSIKDKKKAN